MARKTKRQAQETRQQIIDAALRLFTVQGVSATSLSDIATEAGVTRGAIYWHFKNKVDLFTEACELTDLKIESLELEYQSKYPDDPLFVLRELLIYILTSIVEDPKHNALLEIYFHKCEFVGEMTPIVEIRRELCAADYSRIEQSLFRCIEKRQLPANLDLRRAAIMLRAMMTGLAENWLFSPESFSIKEESQYLVDSFIDMIKHSVNMRISALS
ncbi:TPA: multidrug efflux transporter transcriptional repressor AcrR [Proteus mirabilis]|uniref:multidrug efflux transporter transcriptional repressor AcrR n=1 Tax=Proteus mirabilis TaxID=584 RepID=UPI000666E0D9|nr:multidrug efflux transporter transcriptional repressor AcrR [Proteus mirabilis]MBG3062939.1 multidrug efflux transporter transcriptional repressor AcrR [Proteus mirabilis]HEJ9533975.1 multidrug efflux transporter transcriptional repressor AcrR [Proteus mirabilis]HEJ9665540.1 multidrug efflux transporter transcriptional repressor AcrR [Proteus mirabilis]HEK1049527.1 multidrug efflux transporter transcriptional repressor AcrR [Proteus mirabilis]HEK2594712.1 multidrug efflux transporter transc